MLEEKIKALIIEKYGSVRQFAFKIDIPYTTVDSILKRGIDNSNVGNVIKMCKALNISIDSLLDNQEIITNGLENNNDISNSENLINASAINNEFCDSEQLKQFQLLFSKIKDLPEESQQMIYNVTKSVMDEIDKQLDNKDS